MIPRKLCLLLALLLLGANAQAQDPLYSQFYAAPLHLNPAFAGTTLAPRVAFNYRNQYPTFNNPVPYVTYAASFEQEVESLNSGFGFLLVSDQLGNGIYRTNYLSGIYGYKVQLNKDYFVRFGLEAGLYQARLNWDELFFYDQIDRITGRVFPGGGLETEEVPPEVTSVTLFDASAGILFYGKQMYAGLSVKHLNRPNETFLNVNENLFSGRPMRITAHAGAEIDLGRRNKRGDATFISPNAMFVKQGDVGQVLVGTYFGAGAFSLGGWYRHNFTLGDAAIISAGFRAGVLRIGYSYDATLSALAGNGNTHELSVVVNLEDSPNFRRKRRRADYSNCFKMFQ
jgi:type IX secretion system PorP/SprF family membrane protein